MINCEPQDEKLNLYQKKGKTEDIMENEERRIQYSKGAKTG